MAGQNPQAQLLAETRALSQYPELTLECSVGGLQPFGHRLSVGGSVQLDQRNTEFLVSFDLPRIWINEGRHLDCGFPQAISDGLYIRKMT